ncbi:MAG: hypothetical protein AAFW84_22405 [Cyanobacteria bacterium J06635_15]
MVQSAPYLIRRVVVSATLATLLLPLILAPVKAQDAPQPTPETELPTTESDPAATPEESIPTTPDGASGAAPGETVDDAVEDPLEVDDTVEDPLEVDDTAEDPLEVDDTVEDPLDEETTSPTTEDSDDALEESSAVESPRALW